MTDPSGRVLAPRVQWEGEVWLGGCLGTHVLPTSRGHWVLAVALGVELGYMGRRGLNLQSVLPLELMVVTGQRPPRRGYPSWVLVLAPANTGLGSLQPWARGSHLSSFPSNRAAGAPGQVPGVSLPGVWDGRLEASCKVTLRIMAQPQFC